MVTRILLLLRSPGSWPARGRCSRSWTRASPGRDLILIGGGLFLSGKSTSEIHESLEGEEHERESRRPRASFASVIMQIALIDIVFSLDSVITAVGMVDDVAVMIAAVIVAVVVMMFAAPARSAISSTGTRP